jgi:two-component system chemotaxis response regulator CheB
VTGPAGAVVALGASAGGVEALTEVVEGLPPDLPAAVLVVLHVSPIADSALPRILSRATSMPVAHAEDGEAICTGRVYVAPPDCHLLVDSGRIQVVRGPKENLMRPAIDPLFRSAAANYGPRTIGVVLSGTRDDGAAGAQAISRAGGTVIVQEPDEAGFAEMPRAAITADSPQRVLPAGRIAPYVAAILSEPLSGNGRMREDREDRMALEARYAALDPIALAPDETPPGTLVGLSCPECSGPLWEIDDGELPRFRCRVGRAYSLDTALEDQEGALDRALWTAMRALVERGALARRIRERMAGTAGARRFERMEREAEANAAVIRNVLLRRDDDRGDD